AVDDLAGDAGRDPVGDDGGVELDRLALRAEDKGLGGRRARGAEQERGGDEERKSSNTHGVTLLVVTRSRMRPCQSSSRERRRSGVHPRPPGPPAPAGRRPRGQEYAPSWRVVQRVVPAGPPAARVREIIA